MGYIIPFLILKMRGIDFEYAIWETLSQIYWCWYPYGRRYPGYIDLDIHMGDGIPDILILNVGGVTPELIWSWGVRSQAEFHHEGHVPKLSSFDREGYVPKLNLITRGTFPSWNRYKGYVPKHKRGESRKILWGTFPSFIAGQFPEKLGGTFPSFVNIFGLHVVVAQNSLRAFIRRVTRDRTIIKCSHFIFVGSSGSNCQGQAEQR